MSTLTKILIVLLSLFSIFLCSAVVTYIGTANNYMAALDEQKDENKVLKADNANLSQRVNEKMSQLSLRENELKNQIALLEQGKSRLTVELRDAKRTSLDYQTRVSSLASVFASFEQTIANLQGALQLTQQQLDKVRVESIEDRKSLREIEASLFEKIAQLQDLETTRRQLLEKVTVMEEKSPAVEYSDPVVTPNTGVVFPAEPSPSSMGLRGLKGLVTAVGQSLVTISLGLDDGVSKGTVFYVTRGDEYICDLRITDVETDTSAGVLELVQPGNPPRINDNVSTGL